MIHVDIPLIWVIYKRQHSPVILKLVCSCQAFFVDPSFESWETLKHSISQEKQFCLKLWQMKGFIETKSKIGLLWFTINLIFGLAVAWVAEYFVPPRPVTRKLRQPLEEQAVQGLNVINDPKFNSHKCNIIIGLKYNKLLSVIAVDLKCIDVMLASSKLQLIRH